MVAKALQYVPAAHHQRQQAARTKSALARGRYAALRKWRDRPHSALNGQSPATARRALELFDGSTPDALAKPKCMSYSAAGLT